MQFNTKINRFLGLIWYLSNNYPKKKEECTAFLGIKDATFYNYRNCLLETGFDVRQKDGRYWIEYPEKDHKVLQQLFHFSEEEGYLLSRCIDLLEVSNSCASQLKQKLTAILNQDKLLESYLQKEKSVIVQLLQKAKKEKKQVLLINYASGNSQSVKNRLVEPFEFKDDFNLFWAFDNQIRQNRQFKVCRVEDVQPSPLSWENERLHRSKPVDIFRNTGNLNKRVECILTLKARNLLVEEYPLAERYLTKQGVNSYLLSAPVAKYEGPGRFVLGLAEDVKPLGDEGFLEYLKEKIIKQKEYLLDSMNIGVKKMTFEEK